MIKQIKEKTPHLLHVFVQSFFRFFSVHPFRIFRILKILRILTVRVIVIVIDSVIVTASVSARAQLHVSPLFHRISTEFSTTEKVSHSFFHIRKNHRLPPPVISISALSLRRRVTIVSFFYAPLGLLLSLNKSRQKSVQNLRF